MNILKEIGVKPEPNDMTNTIYGIGGMEFVYTKIMDKLKLGAVEVSNFEIEIGAMDYGLDIDGIIGFDFMRAVGLIIDTNELRLSFSN